MHRHDQGLLEGCVACELDVVLRKLAGDVGVENVRRYVRIEIDLMRKHEVEERQKQAQNRQLEQRFTFDPPITFEASAGAEELERQLRESEAPAE
jgi:hypothetical protein